MVELIKTAVAEQCGAALKMLEGSIQQCEPDRWALPVGRFPFWHVAYHVLYYTDLYLSAGEDKFRPQPFHRENYQYLGCHPRTPEVQLVADQPYDKPTLLTYTGACMIKLARSINAETEATLAGPSGFSWLPFPRLGGHLYNLRHIQHHVGQLSAFLSREQGQAAGWVRSHVPA